MPTLAFSRNRKLVNDICRDIIADIRFCERVAAEAEDEQVRADHAYYAKRWREDLMRIRHERRQTGGIIGLDRWGWPLILKGRR